MRLRTQKQGYTIVEVMVFLAVSGMMFIMAANFISGKQAKAEFRQGMHSMNSKIQQTINDVSNGNFPPNENQKCFTNSSGVHFSQGVNGQGTNNGCVFIGKILQFSPKSDPPGGTVDPTAYNVFTIAGRQFKDNSAFDAPSSFAESDAGIVTGDTTTETIPWGLTVSCMFTGAVVPGNCASNAGAIGFFGSFGHQSNTILESGSQTTLAMSMPNVSLGSDSNAIKNSVGNAAAMDAAANTNPNTTICFQGGSGQFGSIVIGGSSGQRLTTTMRIGSNAASVGCA